MDSLNKYRFVFYKNNNPFLSSITIEEDCVVSVICRLCKDIFNIVKDGEEDYFKENFYYVKKDEDLTTNELNGFLKQNNKPEIHLIFKNEDLFILSFKEKSRFLLSGDFSNPYLE